MKHSNIDFGRPWSGWVGTNVIYKEEGLVLRISVQAGNQVEVYQMGSGRIHGGYFEVAWPGEGFRGYNQQTVSWRVPYTGTFTLKVKGDVGSIKMMEEVSYGATHIRVPTGGWHIQSWYEPGRTQGMQINNSYISK